MTRFARAKGSKSSNERVPDEATPWNVMKMQLEDSQAASKPVTNKPKTAKQLLAEKDEVFYHNTTGNVNHEWAKFDDVAESKSKKDEIRELHKTKSSKKDKKKMEKAAKLHLSNGKANNDQIVGVVEKAEPQNQNDSLVTDNKLNTRENICKLKSKKKKRKKSIADGGGSEIDSKKVVEQTNVDEDKAGDASSALVSNDTFSEEKSDLKSKKRAKRSKKSKSSTDTDQTANQSNDIASEVQQSEKEKLGGGDTDGKESISVNVEGSFERLSKRQKRNKNKQMKIVGKKDEKEIQAADKSIEKKQNHSGFDVQGNDWNNEVKFGKKANSQSSETAASGDDNQAAKMKNIDKTREKLTEKKVNLENDSNSGEAQKDNNNQSKKSQKRKGGKNDNKEYKRRKPDEGVVKMIINGNEIVVVKYDGFPVKKEDADRLQELKKTMIIKGIPRSEINVAMKLERRKAEKALARERKRVCFHCRKSGHNLSDCPELGRDEAGSGICFKCGSAEHTHFECRVIKGQEFRHASCFICREQGHIARQCPDNPKGLYPQGGGCKICGDVTHLKKDCPDLIKEKEETNVTADKIVGSQIESLQEDGAAGKSENHDNKAKSKIVKF